MILRRVAIWLCVIAAVGALSLQEYMARHWGGGPLGFSAMTLAQVLSVGLWAALTPTVIAPFTNRFPIGREHGLANLVRHLAAGAALSVVHLMGVSCLFAMRFYGWSPAAIRDVFRDRMHSVYALDVLLYLGIVAFLTLRRTRDDAAREPRPEIAEAPVENPAGYLQRILVKNEGRIGIVPVRQLSWLEAADNDVVVHTESGTHTVRSTLARFADRLDPKQFVRVHRSAIVNIDRVREVQPWFHGELVVLLKDDTRVTIGRTYREGFLNALEG
jgi:hypothetical protein